LEGSKVVVMLIVVLLFGVCLGIPISGTPSGGVSINHWTRYGDDGFLAPTVVTDNASLNNNSLLWANLSSFAGSNIDWNGATMKFDGLGAGGIGNPFDQDLNTTDPAIFTTLDTGQGALELYEVLPAWMTDWNTSYGWGDHPNTVGDGDPFFNASDAFPLEAGWMAGWNASGGNVKEHPFDQELNTTDSVVFDTVNVSTIVELDAGVYIDCADTDGSTGFVMPSGRVSYPFRYNDIDTDSGLLFDPLGYIKLMLNGNELFSFDIHGAGSGTMEAISSDLEHTNYTATGISIDSGDSAFFWANDPDASFDFDLVNHFELNDLAGNMCHSFKITGVGYHKEGCRMGTDGTNYEIDDSSTGAGSAALYIGNQQITTSSDIRIKRNVSDTGIDALSLLDGLRVVDFEWDDPTDTAVVNRNSRGRWTGMIAQETVDVVPWIINAPRNITSMEIDYASENIWNVEYHNLVPVLVKAIQEQQDVIDGQDERMDSIESRLDRLERNPFVRMFS